MIKLFSTRIVIFLLLTSCLMLVHNSYAAEAQNVLVIAKLIGGRPKNITIKDNYAYVATTEFLSVFDLSNP